MGEKKRRRRREIGGGGGKEVRGIGGECVGNNGVMMYKIREMTKKKKKRRRGGGGGGGGGGRGRGGRGGDTSLAVTHLYDDDGGTMAMWHNGNGGMTVVVT